MRTWIVAASVGALAGATAMAVLVARLPESAGVLDRITALLTSSQDSHGPSKTSPVVATPQGTKNAVRAVTVESALARGLTTTRDLRAVGSLASDESVKIAAEIAGRLAEINFAEGQPVAAGAVLARLDDALARAELADAQARFDLAEANFGRARTLARTGNVTERARDEATASLETSRAAVELARVRLDKHAIRAPFPGVVGIRNVSPGAFIGIGATIVNLEKADVLKLDFKLPEIHLADVRVGQTVEITLDALPGRAFEGTIYAINPMVDANGRALEIRARLANPDFVLRPGLFARVVVKGTQPQNVVMVPESAIVPRGGETFVYRIDDGRAVESKVRLGERRSAEVEILDGLTVGSMVVTAGQQKLRNGVTVEVVASERAAQTKRGS